MRSPMDRNNDSDRFGMPEEVFDSARQAHQGINRAGMFVPTRMMVRTMSLNDLDVALDLWMYESPAELIPSNEQIHEVIYEMHRRLDHLDPKVLAIIKSCEAYICD